MKNELVGLMVGIVCALALIGTILVPMVDEVTAETKTYTNEGMPYAAVDEDDHTILVTADTITVDGESLDLSLFPDGFTQYTLVFTSDGDFIRMDYDANSVRYVTSALTTYSVASDETVTISISGSDATVSSTDTTVSSRTLDNVTYYVSSEGDYVMALNPCVTSESVIIGAGQTNFGTALGLPEYTFTYASWSGTIESVTGAIIYLSSTTSGMYSAYTISSTEVNTTEVEGDLVRIDSVLLNYTLTSSGTDYDVTATYTYFLAPSEVVYDNPDYIGDTESALLSVIPLFTILAVFCVVVYAVMRNRD